MIGIVDYGAGNLKSVKKAFDFIGAESRVLASAKEFNAINRLVLPGVGSFGYTVERMMEMGFYNPVREWVESNRSFLGICLGLQLLFESSEESEGVAGLSLFKGKCRRFNEKKVPQIGWNTVRIERETDLLKSIPSDEFFYFVHSYFVVPENCDVTIALSNYGVDYASIVGKGNIFGVQFHPEKSGHKGLKVLRNWVERC